MKVLSLPNWMSSSAPRTLLNLLSKHLVTTDGQVSTETVLPHSYVTLQSPTPFCVLSANSMVVLLNSPRVLPLLVRLPVLPV